MNRREPVICHSVQICPRINQKLDEVRIWIEAGCEHERSKPCERYRVDIRPKLNEHTDN